jgi:3-isopropylmalate dehydrogenase
MTYLIGVLNGDGIGSEVVPAAIEVADAALAREKVDVEWRPLPMGLDAIASDNHPMPERVKAALGQCHGWVMGPHDNWSYPVSHQATRNPSGELRHHFGLYSNVRPAKAFECLDAVGKGMDVVVFRENTEGFYSDRNMIAGTGEWEIDADTVITAGLFTRGAAEKIAEAAFRHAMRRRKHVTIVHKANVIKKAMGLFLDTCRTVGQRYPEVAVADEHIDAMTALLVRNPTAYDVIVTTNMFGDILSDLTAELAGGLGLAPSVNHNAQIAMAQATHGSAPDIAGKGIANPVGEMLSVAMLFDWLGDHHSDEKMTSAARLISREVETTLAAGITTRDLGGSASTDEVSQEVVSRIGRG